MNSDILGKLESVGAIQKGHFQLTSGNHSDTYIQCARLLENPTLTYELANKAVANIPNPDEIDLIASPAVGGMLFGFAVAHVLDKPFIFSERKEGNMVFRRGFSVPENSNVLVVEDVVTTGGSVQEVCDLIKSAGGHVLGVVSIIDRGADRKFSEPLFTLLELPTKFWDPNECILCEKGLPIESLGSRNLEKK